MKAKLSRHYRETYVSKVCSGDPELEEGWLKQSIFEAHFSLCSEDPKFEGWLKRNIPRPGGILVFWRPSTEGN